MLDFNYAYQVPAKVPFTQAKQEIIVPEQKNEHFAQITSLPSLKMGYNGIMPQESPNVSVQYNSNIDLKSYQQLGENAVNDIKTRAGKKGENLFWVNSLQTEQLKNLDSIYNLVSEAKKGGEENLVVLGMGGSRYSNETLVKLLGKDSKVSFYSAIDDQSFENFTKNMDLKKTKILVVSKSGGTLETTIAYQKFKKLMQDYYKSDNVSEKFVAMTNPVSEKSKLRQIVDKGEIKYSGKVHDDISGGYSMFDDATLFTLAYAGVDKADAKKLLESSIAAQKEYMNPDINKNSALKLAAFNVEAKNSGKIKQYVDYFGDYFKGAAMWEKQLKNEGLKSNISTDTNVGPEFLHYITEGDLDSNNKDSSYTFVYAKPKDAATTALINGAYKAYSEQHPTAKIELKDLSLESIAKFVELKHFETLYTGNIIRQKQNAIDSQHQLPEVIQTNVDKYKKEVKKNYNY